MPLPRGFDTVDRLLRRPGAYPEPDGWEAVEAVLVGLAGLEPLLVRAEGLLGGFDGWNPSLLRDPRHRALWAAYARVRAAGDDVRCLDVLGAALDVADPGALVEYVSALWAEYPSSALVNLTRARELLEERPETERELERATELAQARGVLPRLRVVETPQVEPVEAASQSVVVGTEETGCDAPPRSSAHTSTGDAVESPASGGVTYTECPTPFHRVAYNAHVGTYETVPLPCKGAGCPYCRPRRNGANVAPAAASIGEGDAWVMRIDHARWDTIRQRLHRRGVTYWRGPVYDGATHVGDVVITPVEVPESERVDGATAAALMAEVLDAVPVNVGNVRVGTSREWCVTRARKAQEADTEVSPEHRVEWLHVSTTLDRMARQLEWWHDRAGTTVARSHRGTPREVLRATGVTPQVHDALVRNGALVYPEALGEAQAARKRARLRAQLDVIYNACPWMWMTTEVKARRVAA